MNWFQRYGLPGAYFVGLLLTGLYALYPGIMENWHRPTIVGLAAIAFLPLGYILTIGEQVLHLKGWGERITITGPRVHKAALDKNFIKSIGFPDDKPSNSEAIIEARTLLLFALHTKAIRLDNTKFIRDWISRRADVIAINSSIIAANFLTIIILTFAFFFSGAIFHGKWLWVFAPTIILVWCEMYFNRKILAEQIIEVIAGLYRNEVM